MGLTASIKYVGSLHFKILHEPLRLLIFVISSSTDARIGSKLLPAACSLLDDQDLLWGLT